MPTHFLRPSRSLAATLTLACGVAMLGTGCAKSATPRPFGAAGPSPEHATPPLRETAVNIAPVPPAPSLPSSHPAVATDVLDIGGRDLIFVAIDGPAAVAAPDLPAATVEAAGDVMVVVQPGQTLFAIAREHLGSGGRWRELVEANPGLDPITLRAGQRIRIP